MGMLMPEFLNMSSVEFSQRVALDRIRQREREEYERKAKLKSRRR